MRPVTRAGNGSSQPSRVMCEHWYRDHSRAVHSAPLQSSSATQSTKLFLHKPGGGAVCCAVRGIALWNGLWRWNQLFGKWSVKISAEHRFRNFPPQPSTEHSQLCNRAGAKHTEVQGRFRSPPPNLVYRTGWLTLTEQENEFWTKQNWSEQS